jgi:uncharacterized membrane protein YphA (DoxX/SURF4 family)
MLSVFPELFNYSQIAPFLLRVALGIILISSFDKTDKKFGIIKILMSILLLIGLFVQPTVIVIIAVLLAEVIILKKKNLPIEKKSLTVLIIVVCVSLLFLGPGLFSFDLPL